MTRRRQGIRLLALTAAVLLLWCQGLNAPLHAGSAPPVAMAAMSAAAEFSAPATAHPHLPQLDCCFGTAGGHLLSVTLARLPTLAAPLVAALLSVLLLFAARQPLPPSPQRLAPHRTSLVAQAVLIRI